MATRASCVSLAAALVAVASGCGGTSATSRGHGIFERQCSSCHTLTGHDTRADGGDLAVAHMAVADIASFARVMPVQPPLSQADAVAVARYIRARSR